MRIEPTPPIQLQHRAHYLAVSSLRPRAVVMSPEGLATLIDNTPAIISEQALSTHKINSVALYPTHDLVALVEAEPGRLVVANALTGERVYDEDPHVEATTSSWWHSGFDSCHFDEMGNLYTTIRSGPNEFRSEVREPTGWSVTSQETVSDPFGGSAAMHFHTNRARPGIWLAAGQDGQEVLWIDQSHSGLCHTRSELKDVTPPICSKDGGEFLVVEETGRLSRHSRFPEKEIVGAQPDENLEVDFFVDYLSSEVALAKSISDRLFLVRLSDMTVADEVSVRGHEPKPVSHYYPRLKDDSDLCTDLLVQPVRHFESAFIATQRLEVDSQRGDNLFLLPRHSFEASCT